MKAFYYSIEVTRLFLEGDYKEASIAMDKAERDSEVSLSEYAKLFELWSYLNGFES